MRMDARESLGLWFKYSNIQIEDTAYERDTSSVTLATNGFYFKGGEWGMSGFGAK